MVASPMSHLVGVPALDPGWRSVATVRAGHMGTRAMVGAHTGEVDYAVMLTDAFHLHSCQVRRLISHICGHGEAADVTQEVFTRLWTNPTAFDPQRGSIGQYLMTIARGVAIDHVRRNAARSSREEREEGKHRDDGGEFVDDVVIAQECAGRIVDALARLPAEQRALIIATYYGHMTYRAAAALLDISEGTAKSRIRSALTRLRFDLQDVTANGDHKGGPSLSCHQL